MLNDLFLYTKLQAMQTYLYSESSGIVRVLGKKYIKRLLTVNTMYYTKPQNPI